ncbi:ABC transporter permease [Stutzerimonas kirkiae]|uniref:ABC transporter permease n=1 Tax=Stutzerimonas kirkiae TaxID=2211392 RepID=A0A4Q9R1K4_9GAMM|nr:ABC transporter permease [Stutzerimonas kirkiae]TBU92660.1 ABC transporter permease [Stutzerimonas kirkiae]TBV00851.1 ABC transporter permease [Stutzerimonas kirkiae]TBV08743.1 ABC transporter permease [Stutzerimonas kirkiae]TBV11473.1 ABC transporter permease [Stutzerimonas kirkiae]
MYDQARRRSDFFIRLWVAFVLLAIYLPILCSALAGLSKSRYFVFPVRQYSSEWWQRTLNSVEVRTLVDNSISIALLVTAISVLLAFFGALAFARYDWKGRKLYQKLLLLPIFFPQAVLGLALLLWLNALGIMPSWKTAVLAHLVWIVPVVTLVIAIKVYSYDATLEEAAVDLGASRWMVFREVTLPLLWPGIWSGALFAFLLSWGNFPLSLYTAGADSTVPKWLYSKMVSGYTPMVPALGTMSTLAAMAVLLLAALLGIGLRRFRAHQEK